MATYQEVLMARIEAELATLRAARRDAFLALWQRIGADFCRGPASAKVQHHHCWAGGLAEHALGVLAAARRLAPAVGASVDGDASLTDAITVACLFHDLGKSAGFYWPLREDDPRRAQGERWSHALPAWRGSHALRSLFMLQEEGVVLTSEEWRAILLHDGQYVEANAGFKMVEPDLALVLHWADLWDARHAPGRPADAEVGDAPPR